MPISDDDLDQFEREKHPEKKRPKGKIPYPPERNATFSELRQWLSNAIGLPDEVRVQTVVRAGRDGEDPVSIVLSNDLKMRCSYQKRLQQPRTLQAFLVSESDGIAQAPYLSPAEAGDVYTVICRLGTAAARSDPIADLHERLAMFVAIGEEMLGSLNRESRYVTIEKLRKRRPAFDRSTALAMKNGTVETQPIVLIDVPENKRYVRASEWVAYLRFAQGRTVDESRLVAQMSELGSERIDPQAWNADRSHKTHLVFYTLPEGL